MGACMNAYELSAELQQCIDDGSTDLVCVEKAAKMILLQASKISDLIKTHKYDPETGEPLIDGYPLFSGLPRQKPLSDEEIEEIINKHWNREYGNRNMLTLCRAIEAKVRGEK